MIAIRTLIIIFSISCFYHYGICQNYTADYQLTKINNVLLFSKSFDKFESDTIELSNQKADLYKNRVVPIFMIISGIAMAGIWTADIISGKFSDQGNFFKWKEGENLMWTHILAEYLTSAALITGGIGLYNSNEWAVNVSFVALGSLAYAAINSSGWVLAVKERIAYGIPMWVCLTGSIVSFVILIK